MTKFKTFLRSAWAVLAGYLLLSVLIMLLLILCMLAVPAWRDTVTSAYLVVNILLSIFSAACGGWLTARLALSRPLLHGLILGLLTLLFGIIYALSAPAMEGTQPVPPAWYGPSVALLSLPSVLLGAWLQQRRTARRGKQQQQE
jgi:hypothetical protein